MSQFGGKDLKRHFTVVMGGKEHGLYVSSTPSSAAKKAVTKLCSANKSKKVEFSIREITQGSKKKTYGPYEGHIEKLKEPIELKGRVIKYKPVAKLSGKIGAKKGGGWEDVMELQMNCWIDLGHDVHEITNQYKPYNGFGKLTINYHDILVNLLFEDLNNVKKGEAFIIDADKGKEICDVYLLYRYHILGGKFMLPNNRNGTGSNKEAALKSRLQLAEFGLIKNLSLVGKRNFFENTVDNNSALNMSSTRHLSDEDEEIFLIRIKRKILQIRREYLTFCEYILKNQLKSVKSPTITDNNPPNKNSFARILYDNEKRREKEEQRRIHENSWKKHMKEILERKIEDESDIKDKLQKMMSNYPNFSNQKEHTIQIKYVEKTNKHESGVIFKDVTDKKEYLVGFDNIEFAKRIFEGLTEGDTLNSNKEIIVKGKKYIELILALRRNATLLGSNQF